jgi:hypothetical protein
MVSPAAALEIAWLIERQGDCCDPHAALFNPLTATQWVAAVAGAVPNKTMIAIAIAQRDPRDQCIFMIFLFSQGFNFKNPIRPE